MNAALIFSFGNAAILLGWLLLLVAPRYKYTQLIINHGLVLLFSIVYTVLIFSGISDFDPNSFSTLANVKALFQNDVVLTAGWFHYLAFDLFVGAYIVYQLQQSKSPRWLRFIILPFTFMFGPVGYVLFCASKFWQSNQQHKP
ncbi:MAG: hypothetical protein RL660_2289 [Bacteroidota bacterium]|jgi:hypothetical protein